MRSLVKVIDSGEDVIISLAIRVPCKVSKRRLPGMTREESLSPKDFLSMQEEYGITVVLAYLRSYLMTVHSVKVKCRSKKCRKKRLNARN